MHPHDMFVKEPSVTLVAVQQVQWDGINSTLAGEDWAFSSEAEDAELLVEFGGRACYDSFGIRQGTHGTDKYIKNILRQCHGSVIEHAVCSLYLQGISRSLSHELVRHRHLSISQRSQRYVDESSTQYVIPPLLLQAENDTTLKNWVSYIQTAHQHYEAMAEMLLRTTPYLEGYSGAEAERIRRKQVRETSRSVLPNATSTEVLVTANVRAWRHFITMRATPFADPEIRRLAVRVWEVLEQKFPSLFQGYTRTGKGIETVLHDEYKGV